MSALPTRPTPRRRDGRLITDHRIEVPLDHARPGELITVFAREVVRADRAGDDLPVLLWFQGGPGGRADRPIRTLGWLDRALEDYKVILLDQRGTGLSSPVTRLTLPPGLTSRALAERLLHYRASDIVADAEAVRRHLGIEQWAVLGQSYGGFLAVAYLCQHPEALSKVFITAGLPSLTGDPDDVYRRTYAATARRCDELFAAFPEAEERAWAIAAHLSGSPERLPSGEPLTVERFQTLGIQLGAADGVERLGYLLETAFVETARGRRLSDAFLREVDAVVSLAARPLYAVLHELIYSRGAATRWSAHRIRSEFEEFSSSRTPGDGPFRFTGEMMFPWQFLQDSALIPFAPAAEVLAQSGGLGDPYDEDVMASTAVPVAAAVFVDDMFVPAELSLATAERIRGIRLLITNEYQHDGIRVDGAGLVSKLFSLLS